MGIFAFDARSINCVDQIYGFALRICVVEDQGLIALKTRQSRVNFQGTHFMIMMSKFNEGISSRRSMIQATTSRAYYERATGLTSTVSAPTKDAMPLCYTSTSSSLAPHEIPDTPLDLALAGCDQLLVRCSDNVLTRDGVVHLTRCVWEVLHKAPVEDTGGKERVDVANGKSVRILLAFLKMYHSW
jgi:hypothetical protein